jgi:hypothetical protein
MIQSLPDYVAIGIGDKLRPCRLRYEIFWSFVEAACGRLVFGSSCKSINLHGLFGICGTFFVRGLLYCYA